MIDYAVTMMGVTLRNTYDSLVALGSRTGDGTIVLSERNLSGISGTVDVAYTVDDTVLLSNTLTFPVLSATSEVQFASWFSRYFIVDGINVYSGTTGAATALTFQDENGTNISGVSPKGKSILIKGERLWLTRDPNYPTRIYFSLIDSYLKFGCNGGTNVASWIACDRDDGQAITGFIRYSDRLFVTKRQKSYWIYGDPSDEMPYSGTLQIVDGPATGAYDQKTIINCPDGFIRWFGPDGVYQCSGSTPEVHISDSIDSELNQIADADKSKACAEFVDHYYLLMLPGGILDYCDGFALDTRTGEWFPIKNWNISCMHRFADDTLHAGFYNEGYTAQLFDGTLDNSGAEDIACYAKSRIEFPPGFEYKKYEHCLDSMQMFNIRNGQSFNLLWNANEGKASGSWPFSYEAAGEYLGEFELGDDSNPDAGDIMISEDELTDISGNPSKRMSSAQRFVNLYVEISESGPTEHAFDYLGVSSYPVGEVR